MDNLFSPKGFWLTVNRACNLRCHWCYAKGTGFSNEQIEIGLAKDIIDFMAEHNATRVTLLGGETTLYSQLPTLLRYCQHKRVYSTVVSNGLRLADENYLDSLIESGVQKIAISLKGTSEKDYRTQTGSFGFCKALKAIKLTNKKGVNLNVSTVLSKNFRADKAIELIKILGEIEQPQLAITSCIPSVTCNSINNDSGYRLDEVAKDYLEITEKTIGSPVKIFFFLALPFCLFPKGFIATLKKEKRLLSGCQLVRREGVIFNTEGEIMICNTFYDFPISTFKELSQNDNYLTFWNSPQMNQLYQLFWRLPVEQCQNCEDWLECGGGCPIKWLYHKPSDYVLGERRV